MKISGSSVFQKCSKTFPSVPAVDRASSHHTSTCDKTGTVSSNPNLIVIDTLPSRGDVVSQFSQSRFLLMVYLNAQSCCNKASQLSDLVTDHEIDSLLLTETWLKEQDDETQKPEMTPAGYILKSFPRKDKCGGGLAFLINKVLGETRSYKTTFL